jgi:hypothetical protein
MLGIHSNAPRARVLDGKPHLECRKSLKKWLPLFLQAHPVEKRAGEGLLGPDKIRRAGLTKSFSKCLWR